MSSRTTQALMIILLLATAPVHEAFAETKSAPARLEAIATLEGHKDYTKAIAFTPDGKHMLSIDNSVMIVWDTQSWKAERSFKAGDLGTGGSIAVSENSRFVAVCREMYQVGDVRVWDLTTGKPVGPAAEFRGVALNLKVTNDGKQATFDHMTTDELVKDKGPQRTIVIDAVKGTSQREALAKEEANASKDADSDGERGHRRSDEEARRVAGNKFGGTVHCSQTIYAVVDHNRIEVLPAGGSKPLLTIAAKKRYAWPWGMAFSADGEFFAVEDRDTHSIRVFKVHGVNGEASE